MLIAVDAPERLTSGVRVVLESSPLFISVISYWEIVVKSMKGTLNVGDPRRWWADAVDALGVELLQFRAEHVAVLCDLPPIHQDPFDRALISQAISEELSLVTTDREIPRYSSDRLHVIH